MNWLCRLSFIVLTALGTTFPSAALAQAVDSPIRSDPYRIGIFPANGNFGRENRSTQEEQSADILRAKIQQQKGFEIAFSTYHSELNLPPIRGGSGSVWTYHANRMRPKMSAIRRLARERKLDGVVMAWGDTPDGWGIGFVGEHPKNPVFLYMIDVAAGKLFLRKGTFADVRRMSQQVFSDFLKNRPPVVASVKQPSVPRPTQPAPQTTPYRIAIFPFAGTGCVGQNRPTDEKFAAELGALIAKNGSLSLAYSYYDKDLNLPPIRKPGQLWAGSRPNVARVSSLGKTHRVDAVVMYWRPSAGIGYCTDRMPPYPIHVYIIDTQRKTYWLKGREKNVSGLTEQAFSKFIAARPKHLAAVARSTVAPSTVALGAAKTVEPIGAQAGDWTINYCKDLTVDQFNKAARWAFNNRGFVIEEDTPSSLTGARKGKKIEVAMTVPGHIVIRWVPGFGYEKDNWLKSVKYDVLWGLAGAAQTGEWTINWCKDLTVDAFHEAAKWAFQKRRYIVDDDTPSSLTGALKGRRVEVSMTAPGQIVIRWVPGFGYEKDNWLKNLWRDVSVALAEQAFQTASSGSPFEGITLRPVGSVQAINAAAKAYCGKFNKRSRLIAAPPDNPEYVFRCYRPTEAVSAPTPPPTTLAKAAPATQPDKERELLRSIAGKWRGRGTSARGTSYLITYIFREDGSFNVSWSWGTNANRRQDPPGTLRVNGSHFEYKNPDDLLWTITPHKDKKGRRILKGRREDGSQWQLKRKR